MRRYSEVPQHPAEAPRRSKRLHPAWGVVVFIVVCTGVLVGCGQLAYRLKNDVPETFVPNPLELPAAPDEFVWSQVIDTLDDYFRITRQQPVQNSHGILLDGSVETAYRVGASLLEPWRKDSTAGFERMQSTLQSIRRRAVVTVRPLGPEYAGSEYAGPGYTIEVIVQKDLEDTDRTQYATESTAAVRHDGTILRKDDGFDDSPQTLGWIPLGRDTSLEQVILRDIFARITQSQ